MQHKSESRDAVGNNPVVVCAGLPLAPRGAGRSSSTMSDKDKEPLLGYTGSYRRPKYSFHREEWSHWLRRDYRTTLSPDRLDEFWFRDDRPGPKDESKGTWMADIFACGGTASLDGARVSRFWFETLPSFERRRRP